MALIHRIDDAHIGPEAGLPDTARSRHSRSHKRLSLNPAGDDAPTDNSYRRMPVLPPASR